jgi:uncharacterized protein with HEPN domain
MDEYVLKCLYDVNESINSIESYLGNKRNFIEYQSNKLLRRAVERELEIIGEAINRITKVEKLEIQYYQQIISLRNKIIHSYDNIDDVVIWTIINRNLPVLKKEVEELLK